MPSKKKRHSPPRKKHKSKPSPAAPSVTPPPEPAPSEQPPIEESPAEPSSTESSQNSQNSQSKAGERGPYKRDLMEPWLDAFRRTGTIFAASQMVPVNRRTIGEWREKDKDFNSLYLQAVLDRGERLLTTMFTRGVNGDNEPVVYQGKIMRDETGKIVTVRSFDTALQTFLAKGEFPDKYQDRTKHEIDITIVEKLSAEYLSIMQRSVLDACPHCHNLLGMKESIRKELESISTKLGAE